MKNSQKGMKLNEARYFRQPRPYTRKRIPKMRLIPDSSDPRESVISSPKDRATLSPYLRSSARSRDRCVTLDRDQRSTEIGWISYMSDYGKIEDPVQSHHRDTFAETDPEMEISSHPEVADPSPKAPEIEELRSTPEMVKEIQVEIQTQVGADVGNENNVDDAKPEVPSEPEPAEDSKPEVPTQPEVAERPNALTTSEDRRERTESNAKKNGTSESERSIWSRYLSIRKIIDFFEHLLGKRGTNEHEKASTRIEQRDRPVEMSLERSRNATEKKNNGKAASTAKSRTKRSSKRKAATTKMNVAIEQPKDLAVSGLTKQIMNTRDKRLRATLLEHELRTRKLEEENRRYKRILEDKLKTRQMSSPLH